MVGSGTCRTCHKHQRHQQTAGRHNEAAVPSGTGTDRAVRRTTEPTVPPPRESSATGGQWNVSTRRVKSAPDGKTGVGAVLVHRGAFSRALDDPNSTRALHSVP